MESTKQKNYVLPIAMMFALFAMISFRYRSASTFRGNCSK